MSINLTDKLDEAIIEIEKIIRDKEKDKKVRPGWQSPNASWRSKLLTIRQINCLDKLDYTGPIPKLRGEASDIISKIINKSQVSDSRKNTARKFITTIFSNDDASGITIDNSSDYNLEYARESMIENAKLERQYWRESLA